MTRSSPPTAEESVTIVRPMNRYGTMTVEIEENHETRHLVEYERGDLKSTLAALPEGSSVPVTMRRINCRSNAWEAIELGAERSASVEAAPTTD